MRVRVEPKKREKDRDELIIDVGGMTDWEAEDFVHEVKRRVTFKKCARRSNERRDEKRRVVSIDVNVAS